MCPLLKKFPVFVVKATVVGVYVKVIVFEVASHTTFCALGVVYPAFAGGVTVFVVPNVFVMVEVPSAVPFEDL